MVHLSQQLGAFALLTRQPIHHREALQCEKDTDAALLQALRDALNIIQLLCETSQLPVPPGEEELTRVYRQSRLAQLRCVIDRSLDLLSEAVDRIPNLSQERICRFSASASE